MSFVLLSTAFGWILCILVVICTVEVAVILLFLELSATQNVIVVLYRCHYPTIPVDRDRWRHPDWGKRLPDETLASLQRAKQSSRPRLKSSVYLPTACLDSILCPLPFLLRDSCNPPPYTVSSVIRHPASGITSSQPYIHPSTYPPTHPLTLTHRHMGSDLQQSPPPHRPDTTIAEPARSSGSSPPSPETSAAAAPVDADDDWAGLCDRKERRRRQNRLNQRAYRESLPTPPSTIHSLTNHPSQENANKQNATMP